MLKARSSVGTILYAAFALMLAAFATLGGISVSETRALRSHLAVASGSSAALSGLREVEVQTDAFLRGETHALGDDAALKRLREAIQNEQRILETLASTITMADEGARLIEAAGALRTLNERIAAIAASRPILESAKNRVSGAAAAVAAQVGEANNEAADIALDFEGDRAVQEGPFQKVARMGELIIAVKTWIDRALAEARAGRLDAAASPEALKALRGDLSQLRFQTPLKARGVQQEFDDAVQGLAASAASLRGAALGPQRRSVFVRRVDRVLQLHEALLEAALGALPEAAQGLAASTELDRRIDWAKLELGRAAIFGRTLGLTAERFVEAPSLEARDALQKALRTVLFRIRAAANAAPDFPEFQRRSWAAQKAAEDIDGALDTVLRLSSESERLRRDVAQLVHGVEAAVMGAVTEIEADAAARGETAAAAVAGALALGVVAWIYGLFLSRNRMLLPFHKLIRAMERLADGDLEARASGGDRRDEIGAMARAMEVFRSHAAEVEKLYRDREAQEVARREQIEALLQGIKVLNDASAISEMFDGVLRTLSRLVDYEEAAILLENQSGRFYPVAATSGAFTPSIETASGEEDGPRLDEMQLLEDCDYRIASRVKGLGFRAAMLAPLSTRSRRAMMICARREPGVYGPNDLSAIKAFTPIAEQAVRKAEQVQELEHAVRDLDAMAHHDALTGLKNRKSFINAIEARRREVDQGEERPFALFHIDLDHFKTINDAIGHAAGDFALTWAAQTIQRCMRRQDVVARLGGDEFAVICEDDFEPGALIAMAEKLVEALSEPFEYEGKSLQMGASIGIGRFPADHDDPEQILHIADMALLDAKAGGRGRFAFFSVSLRRELQRRQTLEVRLRDALKNAELEMWYQPIVSLQNGRVESFEALLRWRSKQFGLVLPADFVPVAERIGLMSKIGEWAIRTACSDLKRWVSQSGSRRIALNVAGCQVGSADFVPNLDAIMTEVGLAPSSLELELSEEIAIRRSAELALDNLTQLHERGYQIAFDDFGTGYSSLEHLRRFPGQRMKIDRSFIQGGQGGEDGAEAQTCHRALTRGLFALAKSLGMDVVAEGVETKEQLDFCAEVGCDEVQGFYYAEPMPLKQALLRAERIESEAAGKLSPIAALQRGREAG